MPQSPPSRPPPCRSCDRPGPRVSGRVEHGHRPAELAALAVSASTGRVARRLLPVLGGDGEPARPPPAGQRARTAPGARERPPPGGGGSDGHPTRVRRTGRAAAARGRARPRRCRAGHRLAPAQERQHAPAGREGADGRGGRARGPGGAGRVVGAASGVSCVVEPGRAGTPAGPGTSAATRCRRGISTGAGPAARAGRRGAGEASGTRGRGHWSRLQYPPQDRATPAPPGGPTGFVAAARRPASRPQSSPPAESAGSRRRSARTPRPARSGATVAGPPSSAPAAPEGAEQATPLDRRQLLSARVTGGNRLRPVGRRPRAERGPRRLARRASQGDRQGGGCGRPPDTCVARRGPAAAVDRGGRAGPRREFARRPRAKEKASEVVLVAVARKRLVIADGAPTSWAPQRQREVQAGGGPARRRRGRHRTPRRPATHAADGPAASVIDHFGDEAPEVPPVAPG